MKHDRPSPSPNPEGPSTTTPFASGLALAVLFAASVSAQGLELPDATSDLPPALAAKLDLRRGQVQRVLVPPTTGTETSAVEVDVQLGESKRTLSLRPFDMRAKGFRLILDDGQRLRDIAPGPVITYRGTVRGVPGSIVAATLHQGSIRATIRLPGGDWSVQPLQDVQPGVPFGTHVAYAHRDAIQPPNASCGELTSPGSRLPNGSSGGGHGFTASTRIANLAIDIDYLLLRRFGTTTRVLAHVLAIHNAIDALIMPSVEIIHRVTAVFIRTNPVYAGTTIRLRVDEFRARWNQNHRNIRRDIAHLHTGVGSYSGTIGVAWVGTVCANPINGYGYGASKSYSNNTNNVGLVAHELGHNWGSGHCDSRNVCNVMCSRIGGCSNNLRSFAPITNSVIATFKASARCLGTTREVPGERISASFINNGGFEHGRSIRSSGTVSLPVGTNQLPGWSVFNGTIRHQQNDVYPATGLRCLDLSSTSAFAGVRRDILTRPGIRYYVSFAAAAMGSSPRTIQVVTRGNKAFRAQPSTGPNLDWQYFSTSFVATGNATPIEITSPTAGTGGPYLDDVQVIEDLVVQPVGNPDFETGPNPGVSIRIPRGSNALAPWAVDNDAIDYLGSFGPAASGRRAVDLNGGVIRQSIRLLQGQRYAVIFEMAGNPDGGPAVKRVQVQTGFRNVDFRFDTTGKTRANLGWETKSMTFVAGASSATLAFWSPVPGEYGPLVDNIRILPVHDASIVINRSFESRRIPYAIDVPPGSPFITGWIVTSGTARLLGTVYGAAHGVQAVQLGNGGPPAAIRARIPVVPGRRYRMSFQVTAAPGVITPQPMVVRTPSGSTQFRVAGGRAYDDMGFVTRSVDFVGPADATAWIEFIGQSVIAPLIVDDVDVREIDGHYHTFGANCGRSGGPQLRSSMPPSIGRRFEIRFTNLPTANPVGAVFTSGSRTQWGATPLPLALDFLGATGCMLWVSPTTSTSISSSSSTLNWGYTLPNVSSLIGGTFYNQAVFVDPGANGLNTVVTNAGLGVVGN